MPTAKSSELDPVLGLEIGAGTAFGFELPVAR